ELGYVVEHAGASVLVADGAGARAASEVAGRARTLRAAFVARSDETPAGFSGLDGAMQRAGPIDGVARPPGPDLPPPLSPSGTTSRPKGVMITHAAYLYGATAMAAAERLGPEDRHLVTLPFFHAAAQLHATLPSLLVGASIVVTERFSASRFFDWAIRHRA